MKHLMRILMAGQSIARVCLLQACQESCSPIIKRKEHISEENRAKMAYTGTETLIFLEIDHRATAKLAFKPIKHYDSLRWAYSYYEAPNGDECIGYATGIETMYREYFCEERNWHYLSAMNGSQEMLLLRFDEEPRHTHAKYNFEIFASPRSISPNNRTDSTYGHYYLREYQSLNGLNTDVTRIAIYGDGRKDRLYYYTQNGLLRWYRDVWKLTLLLKEIIRN